VRRRPYSVILLDEVEKAHPEVFDLLLQVFDDGRLTDGQGRTVDFRNAIIIMTSNLGSQFLVDTALERSAQEKAVMETVHGHFKPEFLNRIDEIVIFNRLGREEISKIMFLLIDELANRLKDRRIGLSVDEAAQQWLINHGFNLAFGARPLRRLIQKSIGDKLATMLLTGQILDGMQVIVGVADEDELKITIAEQ
ncbi:MAG: AAA family ATPase, partial [Candidatus Nanopelagicales bacterium]